MTNIPSTNEVVKNGQSKILDTEALNRFKMGTSSGQWK